MFDHEDSDEDDFEGYFLKPVNGYNITEKVKQANQEVFTSASPTKRAVNYQPRVTFRPILEEYEDTFVGDQEPAADEEESNDEDVVLSDFELSTDIQQEIKSTKNHCPATASEPQESAKVNLTTTERPETEVANETPDGQSIIEESIEIGEEIEKNQIEVVCQQIDELIVEPTKSIDSVVIDIPVTITESSSETTPTIMSQDSLSDSLQEFETPEVSPRSVIQLPDEQTSEVLPISASNCGHPRTLRRTQSAIESVDLRLNLRVRPCCEHKLKQKDEKRCLPRYNGYLSQYGLTKDQLDYRERREARRRDALARRKTDNEEYGQNKSRLNEEAFACWLQNKMRNPTNKTKNMYDSKTTIKRNRLRDHNNQ